MQYPLSNEELNILAKERFSCYAESHPDEANQAGFAEGFIIGFIEGFIEQGTKSLVHILTKRLGPLPENLTAKLTDLTDIAKIDQLLDCALDAQTLEDFKKNL